MSPRDAIVEEGIDVANLEPGESAERKRVGGRWKRQRDD
jgi:hypothetical protein